jgi:phage N-6-adenine-methyltransferase
MATLTVLRSERLPDIPRDFGERQARLDAFINYAAKIKDWESLDKAINEKIEEQEEFVAWWQRTVTPARHNINRHSEIAPVQFLSVTKASKQTGVRDYQVSRWVKALRDIPSYFERIRHNAYREANLLPRGSGNHRAQGTGENEWFTPPEYIKAARAVMGGIDLDPATHEKAQEYIRATRYYTIDDDGLQQQWHGRVWLNPPYSQPQIDEFVRKLISEWALGRLTEAIMLTHSYTDTSWFHRAESRADMICFTKGRISFTDLDGSEANPTQGQAFFYFGINSGEFRKAFGNFGFVR